jgi:spermidine/putrescine transport system ATP-binding protein
MRSCPERLTDKRKAIASAGWTARHRDVERRRKLGAEPTVLEVRNAVHRYGDLIALDEVSISARTGEFLTLLGPSGSGKTTLLRIVAGLERPERIELLAIAGDDVTEVPAHRRNCTTVFQHYALFPHMTVGENIEFGLRVRGVAVDVRGKAARDALDLVRLGDKFARRINQLSGGERQRVALARALVTRPAILLLDEPLGALDEKLRLEMQVELIELQRRLGITFVYVTHSQEEALTMSDRIVLLNHGRVEQEGTPSDLFDRPLSRHVAEFMGVENIIEATLERVEQRFAIVRAKGHALRGIWCGSGRGEASRPVCAMVRAERVRFARNASALAEDAVVLPCEIINTIYKGRYVDQTCRTDLGVIKARVWDPDLSTSDAAHLWWRERDCAVTAS